MIEDDSVPRLVAEIEAVEEADACPIVADADADELTEGELLIVREPVCDEDALGDAESVADGESLAEAVRVTS